MSERWSEWLWGTGAAALAAGLAFASAHISDLPVEATVLSVVAPALVALIDGLRHWLESLASPPGPLMFP